MGMIFPLPILRRSTSANFHVRRIHLCRTVVRRPRRDGAITQSRHRYCRHSRRAIPSRDRDTPSALGFSVPRNAGRRGGRGFITSNSMPSRRQWVSRDYVRADRRRGLRGAWGLARVSRRAYVWHSRHRNSEAPMISGVPMSDARVTGVINSSEGRRGVLLRRSNSFVTSEAVSAGQRPLLTKPPPLELTHWTDTSLLRLPARRLVYFNDRSLVILHSPNTLASSPSAVTTRRRDVTAAAVNRWYDDARTRAYYSEHHRDFESRFHPLSPFPKRALVDPPRSWKCLERRGRGTQRTHATRVAPRSLTRPLASSTLRRTCTVGLPFIGPSSLWRMKMRYERERRKK